MWGNSSYDQAEQGVWYTVGWEGEVMLCNVLILVEDFRRWTRFFLREGKEKKSMTR